MLFNLFKDPISLIAFLLAIIIAITIHEFAHAWEATRLKDFTAKYQGRLSLNPARHIDPLGAVFLLLIGFGWGKPVPINPNALRGKYDELKISLAGPASNIILAFILLIPIKIAVNVFGFYDYDIERLFFGGIGYIGVSHIVGTVLYFLDVIVVINIILAAFNILPFYPLDGSKIVTSLIPKKWSHQIESFKRSGPIILIAVIFLEYALHIPILFPVIMGIARIISSILSVFIVSIIDGIKFLISLL